MTQLATLFFSMKQRTAQILQFARREGLVTFLTSEVQEMGSAAFKEEIWGSKLRQTAKKNS